VFAKGNATASQAYVEFVLDFQDYFNENNWRNKSISDFIADFAGVVNQKLVRSRLPRASAQLSSPKHLLWDHRKTAPAEENGSTPAVPMLFLEHPFSMPMASGLMGLRTGNTGNGSSFSKTTQVCLRKKHKQLTRDRLSTMVRR
jgi:hypothetical protein